MGRQVVLPVPPRPDVAASQGDVGRLALTISYDGTDFAGSQVQPGVRTVQGVVEAALADLFGGEERTTFAGRTDRGVHAAGQVAGCADRRADLTEPVLRDALNARLPSDVAVLAVARRGAGFHARYDARWREYRYRVWAGEPAPLARRYVWCRGGSLDAGAMDEAARRLVGRRDFASFAGGGEGVPWSERRHRPRGTERTVLGCRCVSIPPWWTERGGRFGRVVEVRAVADGFLPQMVRNLTAALVEVGRGAKGVTWLDDLLAERDRRFGVATAPAHGLTFWRVGYGDDAPDV